jgi:hypothetical protein
VYPKLPKNAYERDLKLAMELIWGVEQWDENNVPSSSFLPRGAERDAYKALSRLLVLPKNRIPDEVLHSLASCFDPDEKRWQLKAIVKKRHRRPPPDEWRAYHIANFVDRFRRSGKSYDEATYAVAEALGKSHEHIKKIYGRDRGRSAKLRPRPRKIG